MDEADPPHGWTRRAFVKGCVAASAAGVALMGGGALVGSAALPIPPGRRVDYVGCTVVGGPAPQGLPLLALRVDEDGALRGVPEPEGFGSSLDWYRYCGHAAAPGLQDGWDGDERLRYHWARDKEPAIEVYRAEGERPDAGWFLDRADGVVRPEHLREVGWGAPVRWRSEGERGAAIVSAIVLRVDPAQLRITGTAAAPLREAFLAPLPDGSAMLAFVSFCKHLCCLPGWHESTLARQFDAVDRIYCACHHSRYDPLALRPDFFMLRG